MAWHGLNEAPGAASAHAWVSRCALLRRSSPCHIRCRLSRRYTGRMPMPSLAGHFVVALSSRALFDLTQSQQICAAGGLDTGAFLRALRSGILFDDRRPPAESALKQVATGHVAQGVAGEEKLPAR